MKKIKYVFLFTSFFLFLIGCYNQPPKFEFLKNSDYADFYVFNNFKNNEFCINYLFDFSREKRGLMWILTDKNGAEFDGNIFNSLDTNKERFYFDKKKVGNIYISAKVNFLKNTPINFNVEETDNKKILISDFETLTLNTVQNFLDYAEKDKTKKITEEYTYVLYNKNNQEKMKLKYHDKGAWFEVEIL